MTACGSQTQNLLGNPIPYEIAVSFQWGMHSRIGQELFVLTLEEN